MASFTATIKLHNADEKDYETLNAELKKQSFKEIRPQQKNDSFPDKEEFSRNGNITLQEVTDAVLKAAAKTGKKYSFTIIRNKALYN